MFIYNKMDFSQENFWFETIYFNNVINFITTIKTLNWITFWTIIRIHEASSSFWLNYFFFCQAFDCLDIIDHCWWNWMKISYSLTLLFIFNVETISTTNTWAWTWTWRNSLISIYKVFFHKNSYMKFERTNSRNLF